MNDLTPADVQPPLDVQSMLLRAFQVCKAAHYPIWDDEYRSAVNLGIALAVKYWEQDRGASPETLAARFALHACWDTRRQHWKWRRQDQARALADERDRPQPSTPIPLSDFEIIQFVAAHGTTKAARLLLMSGSDLLDLLEGIYARVKQLV